MKKYRLISILVLLFAVVPYSQTQETITWPSLADSPWPIIKGDAQATGRSRYVGPSTNNIVWEKDMPHGIIYGPIIGYDDILYFGAGSSSFVGSNYFYALGPDGTELWTFHTETGYPNYGSAIVGKDSTIYFPSNNSYVYALDKHGNEKWKTGLLSIGLKPVLSISKEGDLYVSTWADSMVVINSDDGSIKFKKYIGKNLNGTQFTFSTEGDKIFYVRSQPGSGESSYLGCADLNGNILWEFELGYTAVGMPTVDNQNNIYLISTINTYDNGIISFTPNGELRWNYKLGWFEKYQTSSIDSEGNIIVAARGVADGDWKNIIYSFNNNGELNWRYVIEPYLSFENTAINSHITVDAEGKIYFGATREGYFYCLNNKGELLWKLYLDGNDFDSSPAIGSDGTLYIGTHRSSLDQNQKRTLIAIKDNPNSVKEEELPSEYKLEQNYPNPFNPSTIIKFSIPKVSEVQLSVYNTLGQEVAQLLNEAKHPGSYEVEFNGSNLSSGVYIYTLQTPTQRISRKMLLIK